MELTKAQENIKTINEICSSKCSTRIKVMKAYQAGYDRGNEEGFDDARYWFT